MFFLEAQALVFEGFPSTLFCLLLIPVSNQFLNYFSWKHRPLFLKGFYYFCSFLLLQKKQKQKKNKKKPRLVGLVVKASASRAVDPGIESSLRRDFSGVESYQ